MRIPCAPFASRVERLARHQGPRRLKNQWHVAVSLPILALHATRTGRSRRRLSSRQARPASMALSKYGTIDRRRARS